MTLPWTVAPLGMHDAQAVAQLHGVGLGFRQRRVDPGLRQVHDGGDGAAGGEHFALTRGEHVDLAGDRREDLRIAQFDAWPGRARACAFCTWPRVDCHRVLRRPRRAVRALWPVAGQPARRRHFRARLNRGLGGLETGDGFVAWPGRS